jgi:hypothetical protein
LLKRARRSACHSNATARRSVVGLRDGSMPDPVSLTRPD